MNNRLTMVALAAALSLTACNQTNEPEVVGGPADPLANEVANAAPPPPLPVIAATHKYRCSGSNEVLQIDWLELNGQPAQVNVRIGNAATPTVLTRPAEGSGPFASTDGATLTGSKDASSVTFTPTGASAVSCNR